MQNLIQHLTYFNSKERFFLAGRILGNPKFTLAPEFRKELGDLLEIPIPVEAFSAMDYPIDWLWASLNLARNEELKTIYSNDGQVIKAQQEDVDWLVAFKVENEHHIVLIEAKGVTGWTNKQMTSKAVRFGDIFGEQGDRWPGVIPHFVMMSSSPPERLFVEKWPHWMAPAGSILWLQLFIPDTLLRVSRCNGEGQADQEGRSWKVIPRKPGRKLTPADVNE